MNCKIAGCKKFLLGIFILTLSATVFGHGLMSDPPARNWICGAVTKPDQAPAGSVCAEAFADDFNGGYQFMSVLTHDVGRAGVSPLPDNVCGFDSETWNGGATPWDQSLDWPTQPMSAGQQTFTWDISWGPHFDDTEEFRYWITKPGFQYQVGQPLSWDDFESQAFCVLEYNDSNPNGNPNVIPEKGSSLFHTQCNVPERSGRHVIYGEWGRNEWTYERFHGCIDVAFDGGGVLVVADIAATPADSVFTGAGQIVLDASGSQGSNLSFQWSLEVSNDSLYSLSSTSGENTVLTLADPQVESDVRVRLQVTSGSATSSTSVEFTHVPEAGASWEDLGAINAAGEALNSGDQVQLRLVDNAGDDSYYPPNALTIDASNGGASVWPYELSVAVNDVSDGEIRLGVLDSNGDISPAQSATENRIYAATPSDYASAFIEVEGESSSSSSSAPAGTQCNWYGTIYPLCENTEVEWGWENNQSCISPATCSAQPDPYGIVGSSSSSSSSSSSEESSSSSSSSSDPSSGSCAYVIGDSWGNGFTATIRVTNNGTSTINGWEVNWAYSGNTSITHSWSAEVSGSNPYSASNMSWNASIQPGQSVEFGFQGSGPAEVPEVTGSVCN